MSRRTVIKLIDCGMETYFRATCRRKHARDSNADTRRRRYCWMEILFAHEHSAILPFSEPSFKLEIQRISINFAGFKTRYLAKHDTNTVKSVSHRSANSEATVTAILAISTQYGGVSNLCNVLRNTYLQQDSIKLNIYCQ